MLNRSVVILRPKQPYLDWAESLNDGGTVPTVDGEKTVHLLPVNESDDDGSQTIEQCFEGLFESELAAWHEIEADWPQNRTYAMFQEWFSVEWHSLVVDLCADPLKDDGF